MKMKYFKYALIIGFCAYAGFELYKGWQDHQAYLKRTRPMNLAEYQQTCEALGINEEIRRQRKYSYSLNDFKNDVYILALDFAAPLATSALSPIGFMDKCRKTATPDSSFLETVRLPIATSNQQSHLETISK